MAKNSLKPKTRKATDAEARAFAEECARMGASATEEGLSAGCGDEGTVYGEMPDEERDALRKVDFSVLTRERMGFSVLSEAAARSLSREAAIRLCLELQSVAIFYKKLDEDMSRELGNAMELIMNQRVERFGSRSQRTAALFGRGGGEQGTKDPSGREDAAAPDGQDGTKNTVDTNSGGISITKNGAETDEKASQEERGAVADVSCQQDVRGTEAGRNAEKKRPKRTSGCADRVFEGAVVRHFQCELSKEALDGIFGKDGWREMPDAERTATEYVFVPASVIVKVHHLHAYCAADCTDPDVPGIVRADSPVVRAREKSPISGGLMAGILHLRGALRVPPGRVCGWLRSTGLALTPQRVYENLRYYAGLFRHLLDRIWAVLLSCRHIQADETPVRYYDKAAKKERRGYAWVFTTGEMAFEGRPLTLFHFAEGRDAEVLRQCLGDYEGTLGSDGHSAYQSFARMSGGKVANAGCLDHFRKRLVMALRAIPGIKEMTEEERLRFPACAIWEKLNRVFRMDRETKKLETRKERDAYRDKAVREAFDELADTVKAIDCGVHPAGSYTARAIKYFRNQEQYLRKFLDDGEVASNNSKCERKFAFFAVLRNQIKMFGSERGAETAAVLESLEQTAREHVGDTRLYYKFLIEKYCPFVRRQPERTDVSLLEEIDTFLPWSNEWKAYEKEVREKESLTLSTVCEHF